MKEELLRILNMIPAGWKLELAAGGPGYTLRLLNDSAHLTVPRSELDGVKRELGRERAA